MDAEFRRMMPERPPADGDVLSADFAGDIRAAGDHAVMSRTPSHDRHVRIVEGAGRFDSIDDRTRAGSAFDTRQVRCGRVERGDSMMAHALAL